MVPWWSWYLYINPIAYSLCARALPAPRHVPDLRLHPAYSLHSL